MEANQEKSIALKVENVGGVVFVSHSEKYEQLMLQAMDGDRHAQKEWLALSKKEDVAIEKARADLTKDTSAAYSHVPETTKAQQAHNKFIQDYETAYNAAHANDQKAADENVLGLMKEMKERGASNQEIAAAGNQAMRDQHVNLLQQTANRKANTLTPSVDNYAPAAGTTRLDISAASATDKIAPNYTANINHGFAADRYGLTRLAGQANASINNEGKLQSAEVSVTAVKALPESMQPKGTSLFVAGGAGLKATPDGMGGDVTLLGVAASNIKGVPVGAYAGGSYDIKSENPTALAKVEAMFNSNTHYPTTVGIAGAHNFGGKQNSDIGNHAGEAPENNAITISAYQRYNQFYAQLTATHTTEGSYGNGDKSPSDNSVGLTAGIQF